MNSFSIQLSLIENATFWFLWLLTAVICVAAAVHAVRRKDQILGFVPVFCMAFGYFYVLQAAVVAVTLSDRLQPWMFVTGQSVAMCCLIGTLLGNYFGSRPVKVARAADPYTYSARNVWYAGVFLMVVGMVTQYTFVSLVSVGEADYSASAYWYLLFYVFYPGLGLCVRVYAGSREYRTPSSLLLIIGLSVSFLYFWVSLARRGPVFPYFVVVTYTYYLVTRRVNRAVVISGLVFVGMLMLMFVMIRDYTHEGGSWRKEQLEQVTVQDVLLKKAQVEGDNEYLYHCAFSSTVYELERFQYGTGYLNLCIHWIPRQWWPDKPTLLDQGWFPRVGGFEMDEVTGVRMTMGASVSGAAEAYQQFSWAVPLFWFGLGWVVGRVYAFAFHRPTVIGQILHVGFVSGTHWLVSQGFVACFVPVMFFTVVPLTVMYCFRERKPRTRSRRAPAPADLSAPASAPARPLGVPV